MSRRGLSTSLLALSTEVLGIIYTSAIAPASRSIRRRVWELGGVSEVPMNQGQLPLDLGVPDNIITFGVPSSDSSRPSLSTSIALPATASKLLVGISELLKVV